MPVDEQHSETERARGRRVVLWVVLAALVIGVVLAAVVYGLSPRTDNATLSPSAGAPTAESTPTRTPAAPVPEPVVTPSRAAGPKATGASQPKDSLDPVGPGTSVEGEDGIRVALTKIEDVQGEAVQPGEVAGPAVRVTVTMTNASKRSFNAGTTVVNAYVGKDLTPAGMLVRPGGVPMYGTLRPGETTYGVYIFTIPTERRDDVTITVDYQAKAPTVVFRGKIG